VSFISVELKFVYGCLARTIFFHHVFAEAMIHSSSLGIVLYFEILKCLGFCNYFRTIDLWNLLIQLPIGSFQISDCREAADKQAEDDHPKKESSQESLPFFDTKILPNN